MTFDFATVVVLVSGAVFQGGQIATLAAVVRSNRDQGRRLGAIEKHLEKMAGRKEAERELSQGIVKR